MSLELNYKVSNIDLAERNHDRTFMADLRLLATGTMSINDFVFFCEAGGASREDTLKALDSTGMLAVTKLINDRVEVAGLFLGMAEAAAEAESAQSPNDLATSGVKKSQQPSESA